MWRFLWVSLPSELLLSCLNFRMNIQCFQGICWSVQKVRDSLFKVVGGDVLESKVKKLLGRTLLDSIDLCPGTWTQRPTLPLCWQLWIHGGFFWFSIFPWDLWRIRERVDFFLHEWSQHLLPICRWSKDVWLMSWKRQVGRPDDGWISTSQSRYECYTNKRDPKNRTSEMKFWWILITIYLATKIAKYVRSFFFLGESVHLGVPKYVHAQDKTEASEHFM